MHPTDLTELTIDGLAVYRLTRLVVDDHIGQVARDAAQDIGAALGGAHGQDMAERLTSCYWCTGWWLALGATVLRRTRTWRVLRVPLALSAITGILGARV